MPNHNPVCSKCEIELRPWINGVHVIEMSSAIGPYKIWEADEWICPNCKLRVVIGFAKKPQAGNWDPYFKEKLAVIKTSPHVRYNYEKIGDKENKQTVKGVI